eukprot:s1173_g12.t1
MSTLLAYHRRDCRYQSEKIEIFAQYFKEIGPWSNLQYLKEIGPWSKLQYLKEIGPWSRLQYLKEIGPWSKLQYLKEIGPWSKLQYLKEIGPFSFVQYLKEIGPFSFVQYLREIGPWSKLQYLKVIGLWGHLQRFGETKPRRYPLELPQRQLWECVLSPMSQSTRRLGVGTLSEACFKGMPIGPPPQWFLQLCLPPKRLREGTMDRTTRTRSNSRERKSSEGPKAAPPPPPTFSTTTSSPLEALVAGMAQIQQVLLKGKSSGDNSEFDPSKAVAEFPKLQENTPESGAIDFQDWLYLVEQQVGSLASGASMWWTAMLEAAMKAYGKYQAATPTQRLTVASELPSEWEDPKYSKLEKRVAAMLVGALPQPMKEEMVAYRVRRVHQQLFRLLVNYQPGGSTDRALVLAQLEPKDGATDPTEVIGALRRWFRWLQRAQDLQLSLPDPSVQIRALSTITKKLAERNADLQFKIALAKTELRVESRPTQDTALRFFQHLLAEIEQLGPGKSQRTSTTTTPTTTTTSDARVKGAQVTPKGHPTSPKEGKGDGKGGLCKWFISDQGCGRGRACRYLHDWTQVVKAERCLVCGSKQHKLKDCPRKDIEPTGDGPSVKGLNKKELKVFLAGSAATAPALPPQPQPSLQQATTSIESMTAAAKAAADPPLPPPSSDALREVLAETNRVLKAITSPTAETSATTSATPGAVQDPLRLLQAQLGSLRRIQAVAVKEVENKVALLDSGASHAYRGARDENEREQAMPVNVKLALGEVTLLQNKGGTLLGDSSADTLVPLGQLVEVLNCRVHWTKGRLTVLHPVHGRLRVRVREFCPELAEHEALRLIAELEQRRLDEMGSTMRTLEMKVAECEYQMEWFDHVKSFVATGERVDLLAAIASAPFFKDLPMDFKGHGG